MARYEWIELLQYGIKAFKCEAKPRATPVPSENTIRRVVKRLDVRIDDGVPRFRGTR